MPRTTNLCENLDWNAEDHNMLDLIRGGHGTPCPYNCGITFTQTLFRSTP
jgi:hypothetical protein